jgi:hypothetical protein
MDQAGSLLDRPKFYNNIDGVAELGGGVMFLGYALMLWLEAHTPNGSVGHKMSFVIFAAVFAIIHYGSKAVKNRITYPRTGFVEYRKSKTVWLPGIIGALIPPLAMGGLFAARRHHWDLTASVPLFGVVFAAAYAYGIARAVRWKWVVVWAIMLGSFVTAFLPANLLASVAGDSWATHPVRTRLVGTFLLSLMIYGTMLLISGGISFWLYLRHTQPPAGEPQ